MRQVAYVMVYPGRNCQDLSEGFRNPHLADPILKLQ